MQTDLLNLQALDQHLTPKLRHLFRNLPFHGEILQNLNVLNQAFVPVLDYNICYKPELGLCL